MPRTDILSCHPEELHLSITTPEPYTIGKWFMAKGAGTIELCKLGELLGVATYKELKKGFGLVGEPLPDGPWPETIHEGLLSALANVSDAKITEVTPLWTQIDEFRGLANAEDLARYLRNLRSFLSANSGPFFLVNSL
jgi:hypothetical protein